MSISNLITRIALLSLVLVSCKTTLPTAAKLKDDPQPNAPPSDAPPSNTPPADVPPANPIKSPFGENDFEDIKGHYTGVMERTGKPCSVTIQNIVSDWRILRELDITFTEWRLLIPNNPPGSTVKASLYFSEPKIGPNTCKVEKEACGQTISARTDKLMTLAYPVYADGNDFELKVVDLTLKDKVPESFTYDEQMPVVFGLTCDRLLTRRSHGEYMMKCQNLKKASN